MKATDYSSVLISIFKRKGAEGIHTRIIQESNESSYKDFLSQLDNGEKGLVICLIDTLNWLMITNKRVFICFEGLRSVVLNSDISDVRPALEEEFNDRVMNKNNFTRLRLKTKNNEDYLCKIEMGLPYQGVLQMLHFIASNNVGKVSR